MNFLKDYTDDVSWAPVVDAWKVSFAARQEDLRNSDLNDRGAYMYEYINTYPALKSQRGYELVTYFIKKLAISLKLLIILFPVGTGFSSAVSSFIPQNIHALGCVCG